MKRECWVIMSQQVLALKCTITARVRSAFLLRPETMFHIIDTEQNSAMSIFPQPGSTITWQTPLEFPSRLFAATVGNFVLAPKPVLCWHNCNG